MYMPMWPSPSITASAVPGTVGAGRLAGKLISKPRYLRFLLDSRATDRIFILTC